MKDTFKELEQRLEKTMAINTSLTLLDWDKETLSPKEAWKYTAKVVGALSEEYYRLMAGEDMGDAIAACEKDGSLAGLQRAIVKEAKEERELLTCIPEKEYRDNAQLVSEATKVWARAKEDDDFEEFAPTLKKVIEYQKKFASYRAKEGQKLYDVMLDTYEKGFNTELLDQFFQELKEAIVPLLKDIRERGKEIDKSFLTGDYPVEKQRELAGYLAEYVGFDFEKGVLSQSAHPFTTNLHNHDVRLTTHYSDRVDSSVFSVIHETGHALYELGISDELTQTPAGQGASTGMHEAQSRFFENIIGRSEYFWKPVYGKLQEIFPEQLGDISRERFVEAINKVEPGLIRTEADELTYSLHIMIRYEIEKMIMEDQADLEKLPEVWADKYEEYLGIRPENPSEGILQDIHWADGSFGYFPSYALGSAFGAQLYAHMRKEMDVDGLLAEGNLEPIREYLRKHVHQYGKCKTSRQILRDTAGEDFTPRYYIEYLENKYRKLYQI